jgi:hypothetical protein
MSKESVYRLKLNKVLDKSLVVTSPSTPVMPQLDPELGVILAKVKAKQRLVVELKGKSVSGKGGLKPVVQRPTACPLRKQVDSLPLDTQPVNSQLLNSQPVALPQVVAIQVVPLQAMGLNIVPCRLVNLQAGIGSNLPVDGSAALLMRMQSPPDVILSHKGKGRRLVALVSVSGPSKNLRSSTKPRSSARKHKK